MALNLPPAPPQYDATNEAQSRRALENEDKKNIKRGVPFDFVPYLPSYPKASLPSATRQAGFIYVTDDVGGAVPAFSDGTNWRRVTDRAVIS